MVIGTKSFVFPFSHNFGFVDLSGGLGTLSKTTAEVIAHLDMPIGFICYPIHELKHRKFAKRRHRHSKPETLSPKAASNEVQIDLRYFMFLDIHAAQSILEEFSDVIWVGLLWNII